MLCVSISSPATWWGAFIWLTARYAVNPQSAEETYDNEVHARARSVVERAIGLPKCRWHALDGSRGRLLYHPAKVCRIVRACGVLHNMAQRTSIPRQEAFLLLFLHVLQQSISPSFMPGPTCVLYIMKLEKVLALLLMIMTVPWCLLKTQADRSKTLCGLITAPFFLSLREPSELSKCSAGSACHSSQETETEVSADKEDEKQTFFPKRPDKGS